MAIICLENHRGFQACLEKLFGLAESMWALKPFGLPLSEMTGHRLKQRS